METLGLENWRALGGRLGTVQQKAKETLVETEKCSRPNCNTEELLIGASVGGLGAGGWGLGAGG